MNLSRLRRMINDGDMSKSALHYLLQCGSECEYLDFKEQVHLDNEHNQVSLSKDIVGMRNIGGGYIVVGVQDKTWKARGLASMLQIETKLLRDMVQKCFGVQVDVDIVQHQI